MRSELRLTLNLIHNDGACWSLSQQQEYTLGRSPVQQQASGQPQILLQTCAGHAEKDREAPAKIT